MGKTIEEMMEESDRRIQETRDRIIESYRVMEDRRIEQQRFKIINDAYIEAAKIKYSAMPEPNPDEQEELWIEWYCGISSLSLSECYIALKARRLQIAEAKMCRAFTD